MSEERIISMAMMMVMTCRVLWMANEQSNVMRNENVPDRVHRAIPIWQWVQKPSTAHCRPTFD